jgi:hypothetical protein
MITTGNRTGGGSAVDLADWQPHVAAGAEQQAPVSGFGVGSPQHAAGPSESRSVVSDAPVGGANGVDELQH